ncbi:MAG: hypothetical protein PHR64_00155 [Candidatus Shapirobacteria bacterium]|nr:hypothetical protein [Candidatus Shapirobacteria bacterium]MDD5073598.1 hypothetical protein [Candidatus Shapirobacteria bacterium]MDD5481351.1 hypothetical protein [Candidatus Shapirobacteria bacterium]
MVAYNQYLEVLVDKEQNTKTNPKPLFLTVYFPNQNQPKSRLKKELKSFILTALKKNKKENLIPSGKIIVEQIYQAIDSLESLSRGLAFFIKFSPTTKNNRKVLPTKRENFIFIPLERVPQKEVFLGTRFDLDQLVWLADKGIDGLIFQINQKEANIYVYDDHRLFPVANQQNPFVSDKEKQYLEQFSPINFQGIFHGTGEDGVAKREKEENKLFLKKLQTFVKDQVNPTESFDYLVINWSTNFVKLNTNFPKEMTAFFPKTETILIDKNITNQKQLEELVIEKTDQHKKAIIEKQLKEAQERFDRYSEAWQEILTAANEDRIQKLFIKPVINKEGYVTPDSRIYNYPAKNSRLVKNIAPWLVREVLAAGGDIIILDPQINNDFPKIAALLRY